MAPLMEAEFDSARRGVGVVTGCGKKDFKVKDLTILIIIGASGVAGMLLGVWLCAEWYNRE